MLIASVAAPAATIPGISSETRIIWLQSPVLTRSSHRSMPFEANAFRL
jgi:hypothetical protein